MPRFAANLTMMYAEYAFEERFAAAARDSFEAVEFLFPYDYPVERLASRLRECGLQQVLINAPAGAWDAGERGIACLPGREMEFRAAFDRALRYADALFCPRIHVMAGIVTGCLERSLLHATYVKNLAWAAEQAANIGVDILIEPINPISMPNYFLYRQQDAHEIAALIGRPNLKVQMDLFHCAAVEGDVAGALKKYLHQPHSTVVGHIQIAGVPDRHEPNTGTVDFDPLFDLIDLYKFDGWIGLEYVPAAGTSAGLDWLRKRGRNSNGSSM